MKRFLLAVCLLSMVCSAIVFASASPAASTSRRAVWVTSIAPSPQYDSNHTLYSVQQVLRCREGCTKLVRSTDGGASWVALPTKRWSGAELLVTDLLGEDVLVSMGEDGVQVSTDGGSSFDTFPSPRGQLDARPTSDGALAVLIAGGQRQYLLSLPQGQLRELAGTDLQNARLSFHPSWPHVPPGQPAAFATGSDRATGFPVLQRCDASFSCSSSTVIDTKIGVARLFVSPSFGRDRTIFAAHSRGGLLRSDDGGKSFEPVLVAPPGPRQLIWTVQAMAFTRDFDTARRRGGVYAGLLSVSGKPGRTGKVTGGVYRSRDGGISWGKLGPGSDLDQGATAVAVAGERVVAAPLSAFHNPVAPILCLVDLGSWQRSCPTSETAHSGIVGDSRDASHKASSSGHVRRKAGNSARRTSRSTHPQRDLAHAAPLEKERSSFPIRVTMATLIALCCAIFIVFLRLMARRE